MGTGAVDWMVRKLLATVASRPGLRRRFRRIVVASPLLSRMAVRLLGRAQSDLVAAAGNSRSAMAAVPAAAGAASGFGDRPRLHAAARAILARAERAGERPTARGEGLR